MLSSGWISPLSLSCKHFFDDELKLVDGVAKRGLSVAPGKCRSNDVLTSTLILTVHIKVLWIGNLHLMLHGECKWLAQKLFEMSETKNKTVKHGPVRDKKSYNSHQQ